MLEGNAMRQSQAGSRLYASSPPSSDREATAGQAWFGPEVQARYRGVPLLYLGISGVLHPSQLSRIAIMEPAMFGVMEPVSGC